jgi:hypothetical protein
MKERAFDSAFPGDHAAQKKKEREIGPKTDLAEDEINPIPERPKFGGGSEEKNRTANHQEDPEGLANIFGGVNLFLLLHSFDYKSPKRQRIEKILIFFKPLQ